MQPVKLTQDILQLLLGRQGTDLLAWHFQNGFEPGDDFRVLLSQNDSELITGLDEASFDRWAVCRKCSELVPSGSHFGMFLAEQL